jgi:hypothetical protein
MVESFPRYVTPPRNMVQEVRNIVEAYKMGPLRALAQDPVQNSLDARRRDGNGAVSVQYRLYERRLDSGIPMFMLTVKDSGTTGLLGPALSLDDMHTRAAETGYLQLHPEENWAAWEAMGYTKIGEDALGSRGQGKAAFLYHSRHHSGLKGPSGQPLERMIILYDSLTPDGIYRLGVRLARPEDVVRYPPLEGDEATGVIRTVWGDWQGPPIPLSLEPLSEIGTRIIVPFLSDSAVEAFHSGEMTRWLERCWWRAVQKNSVEITVVSDTGSMATIGVPAWWRAQPWRSHPMPPDIRVENDIALERGSPLGIKRIVLFHDPSIQTDEIPDMPAQYSGIQLIRHDQWIETLGAAEKYADYIPREKRAGFRGFVEFDRALEKKLREEVESPQHDHFQRRIFVKQIDAHIAHAVREFAESQGWLSEEPRPAEDNRVAQEMLGTVVDTFLAENIPGRRRRRPAVTWACDLDLEFPRPDSARVEWDEMLQDITVSCSHEPPDQRRDVRINLSVIDPEGQQIEIASRNRQSSNGSAMVEFGNMAVVRVARSSGEIVCSEPGKYRLRAQCMSEGNVVATANRYIYVRTDPPPRNTRPYSVDISVHNASADRVRINHGDIINIAVTVSNRTGESAELSLNASLGSLLLADGQPVSLPGRPEGDAPSSRMFRYMSISVFTSVPQEPARGLFVVLEAGRHSVEADVYDANGEVIAHATKAVYIETEPVLGETGLPFEVKAREGSTGYHPVWELEPATSNEANWILWYTIEHPTYQAASAADRYRPQGTWLYGTKHFWAHTYCAALVEWALAIYRDQGNQGGFKLFSERTETTEDPLWERYCTKVEELISSYTEPLRCPVLQREIVGLMLYLLRRR